jgi:hypothetical protein
LSTSEVGRKKNRKKEENEEEKEEEEKEKKEKEEEDKKKTKKDKILVFDKILDKTTRGLGCLQSSICYRTKKY